MEIIYNSSSRITIPPNFIGTPSSDTIQVTTSGFNIVGIKVELNGVINTREGNDTVSGSATGDTDYGISNDGLIMLGSGDDVITGTGSFAGIQVSTQGILDGGIGNDIITGIGNSIGFPHAANGLIINGYLTGGDGDDIISGKASGNGSAGLGVVDVGYPQNPTNTIADGGNGNDIITGIGISENSFGFGFGITSYKACICGGNGDDIIAGYGTTTGYGNTNDISIEGITIIDGGNGNDYFRARRIDSEGKELPNQGGAIFNTLITGGKGHDTFDVGYGNATLDGGQDLDTLILPGFYDNYSILGINGELTILRDDYTLNALNIENIVFTTPDVTVSVPENSSPLAIFITFFMGALMFTKGNRKLTQKCKEI
jgi:Ca2+-binding RTX toxin-like protein